MCDGVTTVSYTDGVPWNVNVPHTTCLLFLPVQRMAGNLVSTTLMLHDE